MDTFTHLLALTNSSKSCLGLATRFAKDYGREPTFSSDAALAKVQAAGHLKRAQLEAQELEKYIEEWHKHQFCALDYVREAVGVSHPPFTVGDQSLQTAHEAALWLAQFVIDIFCDTSGQSDSEWCWRLAEELEAGWRKAFDVDPELKRLTGWLDGESSAASKIATMDPELVETGDDGILDSGSQKNDRKEPNCNKVRFFGAGRYQVGREFICLADTQADVVEALVNQRVATLAILKRVSGVNNPAAVLKAVCNQHPELGRSIRLPGGKGRGGYSTAIVDSREK
jgi:hypothetical protein